MKRSFSFYNVPKTTSSDEVTVYISALSFTLNAFGHQSNDPDTVCLNRITGDFELILLKGGTSYITVSDTEYVCTAGDAVLIPPFTLHSIQTPAQDPHDNYWIHFEVQPFYKQNEFMKSILPGTGQKICFSYMEEVLGLYARMEEELQGKKPGSMAFVNALFMQIVILLFRENGNLADRGSLARENLKEIGIINRSLEFIQSHLGEDIGIEDVSRSLHVSPSSLFKAFSKALQGPPNYFIQMCKIKKAEQLMKSTGMSFTEISQQLAFSSPYYFSSVFKKFYKMSPREYIKNI